MEKQVLSILRREAGEYISGQSVSRRLGVSRTAVWKAIEGLRGKGFRVDSAAGRGYRLKAGPERMIDIDI